MGQAEMALSWLELSYSPITQSRSCLGVMETQNELSIFNFPNVWNELQSILPLCHSEQTLEAGLKLWIFLFCLNRGPAQDQPGKHLITEILAYSYWIQSTAILKFAGGCGSMQQVTTSIQQVNSPDKQLSDGSPTR